MRNRKFHNDDHASAYLAGSVIRVDELPVYVTEVCGGLMYYKPVEEAKRRATALNIPLEHPKIDMNPMPLGFYAIKNEKDLNGCYLKRGPYRQWKIGLTSENCVAANPFKHAQRNWPTAGHILWTEALRDTVLGIYLTPDAAQDLAKKKECTVGFSRNFGVFGDYLLFQDFNEPVGTVINGVPKVDDDFTFLKQQLKADLNARRDN
jgi:hypothetical protein